MTKKEWREASLGQFADASGSAVHEVVRLDLWIAHNPAGESNLTWLPSGTRDYRTKAGIELNPVGTDENAFSMVISGVQLFRV